MRKLGFNYTGDPTGKLVTTGEEKTEIFNNFFASVFTGNLFSHTSGVVGPQDRYQGSKVYPTVRENQVHDHLRNLNIHKSTGPDERHPRVLRELADVAEKPLSMIFERSWQLGEVPGNWKKGNIVPIFQNSRREDPRELLTCQPQLCAWGDHGTNPHGSYAKAHGGQRGDSRQPAWLHQGQVLLDQPCGFLRWSDFISG